MIHELQVFEVKVYGSNKKGTILEEISAVLSVVEWRELLNYFLLWFQHSVPVILAWLTSLIYQTTKLLWIV